MTDTCLDAEGHPESKAGEHSDPSVSYSTYNIAMRTAADEKRPHQCGWRLAGKSALTKTYISALSFRHMSLVTANIGCRQHAASPLHQAFIPDPATTHKIFADLRNSYKPVGLGLGEYNMSPTAASLLQRNRQ